MIYNIDAEEGGYDSDSTRGPFSDAANDELEIVTDGEEIAPVEEVEAEIIWIFDGSTLCNQPG